MNIADSLPENKSSKENKLYSGFKNSVTFTKNILYVTKKVFTL